MRAREIQIVFLWHILQKAPHLFMYSSEFVTFSQPGHTAKRVKCEYKTANKSKHEFYSLFIEIKNKNGSTNNFAQTNIHSNIFVIYYSEMKNGSS